MAGQVRAGQGRAGHAGGRVGQSELLYYGVKTISLCLETMIEDVQKQHIDVSVEGCSISETVRSPLRLPSGADW